MSFEFFVRIFGMIGFGLGGLRLGLLLAPYSNEPIEIWALVFMLVGALAGLILTPHLTTRPARRLRDYLNHMPAQQLIAGVMGLIISLILAALLALPLSLLPAPYSGLLPVLVAIVLGYVGSTIFAMRRRDVFELFSGSLSSIGGVAAPINDEGLTATRDVLLDTSVIIDGRIADISQTGFIMGPMIVPRFVLNELQYIADSSDPLRRNRGRRGIEMLNRMQADSVVPVKITDMDVEGEEEVDEKLILLAKRLGCAIVTNDFNLNRIAELHGVLVLNINDLANAVKTIYLPGEELQIEIIQEGKEIGQGVGFLEDGTMVVIEQGRDYIGKTIITTVTKVLQTSAGRMIFARPV